MLATDIVEVHEHLKRVRVHGAIVDVDALRREALGELNGDVDRGVRGVLDRAGLDPHLLGVLARVARVVRCLEHAALVRDVHKVLISAEGRAAVNLLGLLDRDAVLGGVVDEVLAALEAVEVLTVAPERHALEGRVHAEVADLTHAQKQQPQ